MATLLLVVIFICFISLGIPDALFGVAWPAIYPEFGLPISCANIVTMLISGCTILSSFLSARVLNRFGTAAVTAVSTVMTVAALLGFSLSQNLFWLCLSAVPLGLGAGAVDTGLNNYVALHYKATHMSFMHCFYGVGVSFSPYLMSLALTDQNNWRGGYRTAFFVQLAIAVITILSLPLWKKVKFSDHSAQEEFHPKTLSFFTMCKMPAVRAVWIMCIGTCAIDYTCGIWGSSFLIASKGLSVDSAAKAISLFYLGMTLGRFLSGILAVKLSSWKLIRLGIILIFIAVILLFLPLPPAVSICGLFLIGLGNGPVFPNITHLTPQNFGKEVSQSIMGTQMAFSYIGTMLMPPVFGFLAQWIGIKTFPYYLMLMFLLLSIPTVLLIHILKKQGRYSK